MNTGNLILIGAKTLSYLLPFAVGLRLILAEVQEFSLHRGFVFQKNNFKKWIFFQVWYSIWHERIVLQIIISSEAHKQGYL